MGPWTNDTGASAPTCDSGVRDEPPHLPGTELHTHEATGSRDNPEKKTPSPHVTDEVSEVQKEVACPRLHPKELGFKLKLSDI